MTALLLALMTFFTSAAFAESYSAIVDADKMRVFVNPDMIGRSGTLKKNTIVTVEDMKNGIAKISYRGRVGYASADDMQRVTDVAETAVVQQDSRVYISASKAAKSVRISAGTEIHVLGRQGSWAAIERDGNLGFLPTEALTVKEEHAPQTGSDAVTCNFQAMVKDKKLTVYADATPRAKKLGTMSKGTIVTVLAYNKTWAYIDLDGHRGHVKHSGLTKNIPAAMPEATPAPTATPKPTATPAPTPTPKPNYNSNSQYSNEEIIYAFLINECGFNTAAACGVLANIKAESGFRPTALNSIGCYGICQWYKGRRTRLNNFCAENGYDSATLEGQLWYLKYELQNHYKGTWNYLHEVENTADGAYDAAYYWCYYFEVPENRTNNSIKRGNSAQGTYWPKYSK